MSEKPVLKARPGQRRPWLWRPAAAMRGRQHGFGAVSALERPADIGLLAGRLRLKVGDRRSAGWGAAVAWALAGSNSLARLS